MFLVVIAREHSSAKYLLDQTESIQKRVIRIINNPTIGMPYIFAMSYADLESLKHRRETGLGVV